MVRWNKSETKKAEHGQLNDVVVNDNGDTKTIPRPSTVTGISFKEDQALIGETPQPEDFVDWVAGDRGIVYSGADIFFIFKTETNFSWVKLSEFVA